MARVTETEVRSECQLTTTVDVAQCITSATELTDLVSSNDSDSLLTTAMLKQIELNLARHFAVQHEKNQQYTSRSTEGASGQFMGQFAMGLTSSHYGQNAMLLDVTGYLTSLANGKVKVGATWIGKPVSEQTAYRDRD